MAFKRIPKSSINIRPFKVYKQWSASDSASYVSANEARNINTKAITDVETQYLNSGSLLSKPLLYSSIRTLYYPVSQSDGYLRKLGPIYSGYDNRFLSRSELSGSNLILIDNRYVGEEINPGSLVVIDNKFASTSGSTTFSDDSKGNLIDDSDVFYIRLYDAGTGDMTLENGLGIQFDLIVTASDFQSGSVTFFDSGAVPQFTSHSLIFTDFENSIIKFADGDIPPSVTPSAFNVGNIFYHHGIVTLTNEAYVDQGYFMGTGSIGFTLKYKSTTTITEMEAICEINESEFNVSQNPTANTDNVIDPNFYSYDASASADPTGSYLAPYITSIGLYDGDYDLIAVAKLPQAIKSLPDFPVNIIVRLDL